MKFNDIKVGDIVVFHLDEENGDIFLKVKVKISDNAFGKFIRVVDMEGTEYLIDSIDCESLDLVWRE